MREVDEVCGREPGGRVGAGGRGVFGSGTDAWDWASGLAVWRLEFGVWGLEIRSGMDCMSSLGCV